MTKRPALDRLTEADRQGIQTYAEGYKTFLDEAKTERDAVKEIGTAWRRQRASAHGRATIP